MRTLYGLAAAAVELAALAASVQLRPIEDTTLHAVVPGNNMGAHTHVAVGVTAKDTPARGLFRFDLSQVPTNAVVTKVTLTFHLPALNRPDSGGSIYTAHRLLKAWGEGTKSGNLGAAASAGEATWLHDSLPATWAAPGGQPGGDFVATASAAQLLGPAPGMYGIDSTSGLVADVQHWVSNPAANFGWLLKVQDESVIQTARQFNSRESANAPLMTLEYTTASVEKLRITSIALAGTNVVVSWTGGQGAVTVQTSGEVNGGWTDAAASASGPFTMAISESRRFLRLRE